MIVIVPIPQEMFLNIIDKTFYFYVLLINLVELEKTKFLLATAFFFRNIRQKRKSPYFQEVISSLKYASQ
jgi:hypothetical protein